MFVRDQMFLAMDFLRRMLSNKMCRGRAILVYGRQLRAPSLFIVNT